MPHRAKHQQSSDKCQGNNNQTVHQEIQPLVEDIKLLGNELGLRLGLMVHTRSKGHSQAELLTSLSQVNRNLKEHYEKLKQTRTGTVKEERMILQIQNLEMERFLIQTQLNGSNLNDYALLPLEL